MAFHIICDLPNASHNINGVSFKPHDGSRKITEAAVEAVVAAMFKGIPGYKIFDENKVPKRGRPANDKAATDGETDDQSSDDPDAVKTE
jgi:hypothetical protein